MADWCMREPGVELDAVIVRTPWTFRRIRGELRRDGSRLLKKFCQKFLLRERAYDPRDDRTLRALACRERLPGKTLHDLAKIHGFRVTTVADHNSELSESTLTRAQPDAIIFTGGGLIRHNILNIPSIGVLNCHAGVLPVYRGMDVVEWPVLERSDEPLAIGATLHLMDRGVDTGPILLQRSVEMEPNDTFASIRRRIEVLAVELMREGICALRDRTHCFQRQESDEGQQYYVMHPRILAAAQRCLQGCTGNRHADGETQELPPSKAA